MADILTVREFTQNLRNLQPGSDIVVVDGVRKKIIVKLEVKQTPDTVQEQIIKVYNK
jgi:hypothetical protein